MNAREAEDWILGLELFGMRFGLDRMRRLMTVLDRPQAAFRPVHVVGSNGKSSTARMASAILGAHGLRVGTYLSPHLVAFTERIRLGDEDVDPEAFAAAATRVRRAAAKVDRSQPEGEGVTQFEALTATAFVVLADAGVEVAVVEAGLGGRYDATNVFEASVAVLTGISLEHTRWLGPTIRHIAEEKCDVVRPRGVLVVGAGLEPDALAVAERLCAERRARLVVAPPSADVVLRTGGGYQRRNFATALTAAREVLGEALDLDAVREAAGSVVVPGRFEAVDASPLTILDGAHNPAGMAVLADALREAVGGHRVVACVSILDDKDAHAMLAELRGVVDLVVCTASRNPRTLPAGTVETHARQAGLRTEVEPDPRRALARARELARPDGVALATGSLYLLADLKRPPDADRRASAL